MNSRLTFVAMVGPLAFAAAMPGVFPFATTLVALLAAHTPITPINRVDWRSTVVASANFVFHSGCLISSVIPPSASAFEPRLTPSI